MPRRVPTPPLHRAQPAGTPSAIERTSADPVRDVEQACRERGLRLTPLRAEVLHLVAGFARPAKAYDVLDRIRESKAITAPPTVYRSLDFLLENGFVHKLESINAYVACRSPRTPHTGTFLICDGCQDAIELLDDQLGAVIESRARETGFTPRSCTQTLEIHGLCATCSKVVRVAHLRGHGDR